MEIWYKEIQRKEVKIMKYFNMMTEKNMCKVNGGFLDVLVLLGAIASGTTAIYYGTRANCK